MKYEELAGFEVEDGAVYVATFYAERYSRVGQRLFSTLEKAEAYRAVMGRLSDKFPGEVVISRRYIDETKEQTMARSRR